jgi:hypothetical protein
MVPTLDTPLGGCDGVGDVYLRVGAPQTETRWSRYGSSLSDTPARIA